MAAPKFSPVGPTDKARAYRAPDHVPDNWSPDRPGEIEGFQPHGPRLGSHGPDQGFALKLANRLRPKIEVGPGEHVDDAIEGCLGIALRRASMFSRAPVIHDLNIAFTMWGYFDADPPAELVTLRATLFEGLRHTNHHYTEARVVAEMAPVPTLEMTPGEVAAKYPGEWKALLGV